MNWRDNLFLSRVEALPCVYLGQGLLTFLQTFFADAIAFLQSNTQVTESFHKRSYCCFSFLFIWLLISRGFYKKKTLPIIWNQQLNASWEVFFPSFFLSLFCCYCFWRKIDSFPLYSFPTFSLQVKYQQ